MEMEVTDLDSLEAPAPAAAQGHSLGDLMEEDQEPTLPGAQGTSEDGLGDLPNDVLGDIISRLPTREGAATMILARQWRHLWLWAPLNLDHKWLCKNVNDLDTVVSRILKAHPGPGRRFCAPVYHLVGDRVATAETWLNSHALDNLQELELCMCSSERRLPRPPPEPQPPPAAAFRFRDTLCVATFGECRLPDTTVQELHFPKLKKLGLERVSISQTSLHAMIAACPVLECLLIHDSSGFPCVRINSVTLTSIGVDTPSLPGELQFRELIIEDAPCLQSLLILAPTNNGLRVSVMFAPKLETLGCLYIGSSTRVEFGSTVAIQGLLVDRPTSEVKTVKILSINMSKLSLDAVIDLMGCFPCLEKLYIETSRSGQKGLTNAWSRKHKNLVRSLDIRLKTIIWRSYGGIRPHVNFAKFFVLNARALELMTLRVDGDDYKEEFFKKQSRDLQLDRRVSRDAHVRITKHWCQHFVPSFRIHDLGLAADPFGRKDPYPFRDLC